jgi:hypothetical protein
MKGAHHDLLIIVKSCLSTVSVPFYKYYFSSVCHCTHFTIMFQVVTVQLLAAAANYAFGHWYNHDVLRNMKGNTDSKHKYRGEK